MTQRPERTPSGLFPAGPPRPTFREPHPVRLLPVIAGVLTGALWLVLFGLLAADLPSWAWWTLAGGAAAWLAAAALARHGDRGVATGVAMAAAVVWAVGAVLVAQRWAVTGDWPLW